MVLAGLNLPNGPVYANFTEELFHTDQFQVSIKLHREHNQDSYSHFQAVIMFTVFLQGGTIKLFVNCLHIDKKSEEHVNLTEEINRKLFEHVMTGVSDPSQ